MALQCLVLCGRNARPEEQYRLRLLPGALRGHHLHHQHPAENSLLFLQPDRALRPHLQHGPARLHSPPGLRGETHLRSVREGR